MLFMLYRLLKR